MSEKETEIRRLICELCRQFFDAGWVTGTGGSISIRSGEKIFMTPSGVQKERILPEELFEVNLSGSIICTPAAKVLGSQPKLSECAPLFLHAYRHRNAGAVLHSHAICCNLITTLFDGLKEFSISHQEMIKGIEGFGYFDKLTIPIIENTAREHELSDSLEDAIIKYPKACAVLVRRHGMYVWGNSWEQAKRHGECLHYLFEVAIRMRQFGLDINSPPCSVLPVVCSRKYKHIILDIEGTTTPISFVKDVLFPYSSRHLRSYLTTTWSSSVIQSLIAALKQQAESDNYQRFSQDNTSSSSAISTAAATGGNLFEDMIAYIQECITSDRKITPLKQLQGLIWEQGYKLGDIKGEVYEDVARNLQRWTMNSHSNQLPTRVSIYSSGSKRAQQLIFGNSTAGNLCPYISNYFDTSVGHKTNFESYQEILLTLGATEESADVLFITDVLAEARAASTAGMNTLLSVRAGNATITEEHNFDIITSFDEI